jgi:hypothetical protein
MAIASRGEGGVGGGSRGMTLGSGRAATPKKSSSKKPVKQALKNAKKAKPLAEPKSAVKVKPAAKQKPNKPNAAKTTFKNDSSRNRASEKAYKKVEEQTKKYSVEERTGYEHQYASDAAERAGMNAKLKRRPNLNIKKK